MTSMAMRSYNQQNNVAWQDIITLNKDLYFPLKMSIGIVKRQIHMQTTRGQIIIDQYWLIYYK